ncbi:MAG: MSMEG_0568 family radical SAM protein [archaeon]|nr:MSMEG_0568 family radical SAM protein [archaeon]MCP8315123.1 MSMEG_0568 family radical SAM protein [archaeon]MCP8316860.1 MSMEG_0568 family radical SAM protein [archaeon]MCP8320034.1 MSMEG_0568 family radical SAM protein [archaeon]
MILNPAVLKIELLCLGAHAAEDIDRGRKGGAGPAGGQYFVLPGNVVVNVPLQGRFVENSPFTILKGDKGYSLYKNQKFLAKVEIVPRPKFYEKFTSDGTPMWKIALLHGRDCLASTVSQRCVYWRENRQCLFCGIELSLKYGTTTEFKTPQQLSEVASEAVKEGVVKHVTLTTGTVPSPDKGAVILAEATLGIKKDTSLHVHVQLEPPTDLKYIELLHKAEADTIGIHIESFDPEVRSRVCPAKPAMDSFVSAWEIAVDLFGAGQVSSMIIAGLGESDESIIQGAEILARMGVVPLLVPLRPIIGTPLEDVRPPSPERMISLYMKLGEILRTFGENILENKAGCVRCGGCSALGDVLIFGV